MTLIVMVMTVSNMAILSALLWGCSNQYKSVSDLMINEILTHELQLDSLKICPHQGLSRTYGPGPPTRARHPPNCIKNESEPSLHAE